MKYLWTLKFTSGNLEGITGGFLHSFPPTKIGEEIKGLFGSSNYIVLGYREETK